MDLNKQLDAVVTTAREHAAAVDVDARFPVEAVAALRESGLLGLTVPSEYGGLGAGPAEFFRVVRELAAACGSTAMVYLMHVSAAMSAAAAPPRSQPGVAGQAQ